MAPFGQLHRYLSNREEPLISGELACGTFQVVSEEHKSGQCNHDLHEYKSTNADMQPFWGFFMAIQDNLSSGNLNHSSFTVTRHLATVNGHPIQTVIKMAEKET